MDVTKNIANHSYERSALHDVEPISQGALSLLKSSWVLHVRGREWFLCWQAKPKIQASCMSPWERVFFHLPSAGSSFTLWMEGDSFPGQVNGTWICPSLIQPAQGKSLFPCTEQKSCLTKEGKQLFHSVCLTTTTGRARIAFVEQSGHVSISFNDCYDC